MTDRIEPPAEASVWAQREGVRTYRGHNRRGAEVLMGPGELEGAFTPGELLHVALAGCTGMSSDIPTTRRVGEVDRIVVVEGTGHATEDRYTHFEETMLIDLSGVSDEDRAVLSRVIRLAIDRHCTIGHTLDNGADIGITVVSPDSPTARRIAGEN
ncbi:MAG: OsmC family protein [Propionibacteriaceae bacterium]|jgi:uncharacterized OsmC-like protein|nr:OsmC family protein [Propionibacteriaceae bacterium]